MSGNSKVISMKSWLRKKNNRKDHILDIVEVVDFDSDERDVTREKAIRKGFFINKVIMYYEGGSGEVF